jgi:hypothetical protein
VAYFKKKFLQGLDAQIQEIKESVELPLTHPEYYEEMGIKPPKASNISLIKSWTSGIVLLTILLEETRCLVPVSYSKKYIKEVNLGVQVLELYLLCSCVFLFCGIIFLFSR